MAHKILMYFHCGKNAISQMSRNFFAAHSHFVYLGIILLASMGLIYLHYKITTENENLNWKIIKMEQAYNTSKDRLRLIFFKHREDFTTLAEYLTQNYGPSGYYIDYENGRISKRGDCPQNNNDDERFERLFKLLKKERVTYIREPNEKISINYYQKEDGPYARHGYDTHGIFFSVYQARDVGAIIRYRAVDEFEREMDDDEREVLQFRNSVICPGWSSD